jgi:hypothetical protein
LTACEDYSIRSRPVNPANQPRSFDNEGKEVENIAARLAEQAGTIQTLTKAYGQKQGGEPELADIERRAKALAGQESKLLASLTTWIETKRRELDAQQD